MFSFTPSCLRRGIVWEPSSQMMSEEDRIDLTLHCHNQDDFRIKASSSVRHFFYSSIVGESQTVFINHNAEGHHWEPKRIEPRSWDCGLTETPLIWKIRTDCRVDNCVDLHDNHLFFFFCSPHPHSIMLAPIFFHLFLFLLFCFCFFNKTRALPV